MFLNDRLQTRKNDNTYRQLPQNTQQYIDFCSNDYLGLANDESLKEENIVKILQNLHLIKGATGSRLISGNDPLFEEVEYFLANFFQAEAALLFNSGYDANIGIWSSLAQKNDLIVLDELSHASMIDGARLSKAQRTWFKHNDLEDLVAKINQYEHIEQVFIGVESIYSMDGDEAPLEKIAALCEQKGYHLIVDEAHSTGIYGSKGEGLVVHKKLQKKVLARLHTFGKAINTHGAVVVGDYLLKEYLINFARPFIYSTAMPLYQLLHLQTQIEYLIDKGEEKRLNLLQNITVFEKKMRQYHEKNLIITQSPIQVFLCPEPQKAKQIDALLKKEGYYAKAIVAPTVPKGKERIRICLHSFNTEEEINQLCQLLSTKP
ncbi:MAG: pyridoxal phosphate-dependent aminotransferase family protein [Cytophagales bacterium]|nr:MAG: pyridoxal phosphate-dependent aminotransferase family protein [Cytophagales bacterium]